MSNLICFICSDSAAAEEQENSATGTPAIEESKILSQETITQSTETNTPSESIFEDPGLGRTQADLGEETGRIVTQEVLDILSHVTTLAAITRQPATELISDPYLEESKEQSLFTKDTLGTEGKSFKFAANSESLYKSIRFKDPHIRKPTKNRFNCNSTLYAFSKTPSLTGSLFSRVSKKHYSELLIKNV